MKTLGEISKAVAWSKKQWEERIERADDRKEVKLTTCCSKAHWEETDRYFGRTNGEPEEFYIFMILFVVREGNLLTPIVLLKLKKGDEIKWQQKKQERNKSYFLPY